MRTANPRAATTAAKCAAPARRAGAAQRCPTDRARVRVNAGLLPARVPGIDPTTPRQKIRCHAPRRSRVETGCRKGIAPGPERLPIVPATAVHPGPCFLLGAGRFRAKD